MKIPEKLEKIKFIASRISPYNYFSLGYLDIFYLAYYKKYNYYSLEKIREYWREYLNKKKNVYLNFYIHIPFCEVGCTYCKYFKDTRVTSDKIDKYLDFLEAYFDYFRDVFEKLKVVNIHIGGGTPSLLSLDQIKRLFGLLNNHCLIEPTHEIAFEINPKSINFDKLKLLKSFGVNRLAIGIQSLNHEVLKTVNRDYYNYEYIGEMMRQIKQLEFEGTTLDLLLGLYKDTPLTFMETLKKTLLLKPDRVHVYVVNPPREYLAKYFNNDYKLFYRRVYQIQKVVFPMIRHFINSHAEFRCKHLSFRKKDFDITKKFYKPRYLRRKFGYSDTVNTNIAMLGIGRDARSHLNNLIIYKDANADYLVFNSEKKIFYGHDFHLEESVLKKFFDNLINKQKVDINQINNEFKIDFLDKYNDLIQYLLANKQISLENNILLPKFTNALERFCNALLFLEDKVINNLYENCLNNTYE